MVAKDRSHLAKQCETLMKELLLNHNKEQIQ